MSGQFDIVEEIGRGAYGKVFRAYDTVTRKLVAIKKIHVHENKLTLAMLREASILLDIQHPNIVSMPTNIQISRSFMKGILKAVNHCHSNGIIHRDLKLLNVLVDTTITPHKVKIGDFGLARAFITTETQLTPEVVTLNYRPPELLLKATMYSEAIDIWSIGCMMAELVLKKESVSTVESCMKLLDEEVNLKGSVRSSEALMCSEDMDIFGADENWNLTTNNEKGNARTYAHKDSVMKHRPMFQGRHDIEVLNSIFSIMGTPDEDTWPGVTSFPGYLANTTRYLAMELSDLVCFGTSGT